MLFYFIKINESKTLQMYVFYSKNKAWNACFFPDIQYINFILSR